jgi:tRNA (cytidine/uridine-2'-O-)-methyltransferase
MPAMPDLVAPQPPLQVVLVHPEIPPNTGNVARTCAVTGSRLHLVEPLGFSVDEATVRRAGVDCWDAVAPRLHAGWPEFEASVLRGQIEKLHLFTARAAASVFDRGFAPGDLLVFGSEGLGLPPALLAAYPDRCVGIPLRAGRRSLNLATAVGVGLYQALAALSR